MTKEVFNLHDHFFSEQIKDKAVAKAFFKAYLPKSFLKDMDLDSIELEQIDAKLLRRLGLPNKIADIVFKIQFKKAPAFFILHIEHQSSADPMMPLRMFTYTTHILTNYIKQNKQATKLPPVIGIMYYHGKRKPYPFSTKFIDLFEDLSEEQKEYILNPILIDLSVYDDSVLTQHDEMAPVDILMKHCFDPCTYDLLVQLLQVLKKALSVQMQQSGIEYIAMNYDYKPKEFWELVKENLSEVNIMSIAEQMQREARKESLELVAKNLLADGLEVARVAKNTGLDLETVKKIKETLH